MKVFRMVNENHICRLCVGTGMNEGIQIYKFNNAAVYKQDFYNMTRLNFMYNRRRIFTFNKNGMEYNKYFPFDMVKLQFYGLYLSAYSSVNSFSYMDFDFDIGFNNIEYRIEEKITDILKNWSGKIYINYAQVFNPVDLKYIKQLAEKYELVLSRVPVYANYNIVIYSGNKNIIENINGKILNLKNSKFDIENINSFKDAKNFLLV